jgi:hypothetical protein
MREQIPVAENCDEEAADHPTVQFEFCSPRREMCGCQSQCPDDNFRDCLFVKSESVWRSGLNSSKAPPGGDWQLESSLLGLRSERRPETSERISDRPQTEGEADLLECRENVAELRPAFRPLCPALGDPVSRRRSSLPEDQPESYSRPTR